MKQLEVKSSLKLQGKVRIPASKSHTLRAILFASLAQGQSRVRGFLPSPDAHAMIKACRALGANIEIDEENALLVIEGVDGKVKAPDDVIDSGNSGQVLRFIGAILGTVEGYSVITGDHSVRFNRPAAALISGLNQLGANCIAMKQDDRAPLIIKGPMNATTAEIDGQDSQPVSALLIASLLLPGDTEIKVKNPGETPWIDLTLGWLRQLGLKYQQQDHECFVVPGVQTIRGFDYTVPGDFSSLAYPVVSAILTGSTVSIENVDLNDSQGDKQLLDVLRQMGAEFEYCADQRCLQVLPLQQKLTGIEFNINQFIDAITIMAVAGCFAEGRTVIHGAEIARQKESNRLAVMCTELQKMGVNITETESGLIIEGGTLNVGQNLIFSAHHDHRIAMSLAVAVMAANHTATVAITGSECIAKSYPNFVVQMQALGANIKEVVCQ